MDYTTMNKKEFKKYINDNGFFVSFNANKIDKDGLEVETNAKLMSKLPKGDNILVFEGIASQNYGLGEKNRNGYKIDPKGWDFKNYKNNPIMLLQHNHEYGGIGRSIKMSINDNGDLINTFYVDLNTLDEKTKYQINNGYITAVSTSHITIEDMIEDNKTGERMTWEEASKKGVDLWSVVFGGSNDYTLVVTKAEMIENSMVTIGSNEEALVTHNSIGTYFTNKYSNKMTITKEKKKELLNSGLPDNLKAKLNELDSEKEEEKKEEVKIEEEEKKEEVKIEEEEKKEEIKIEEDVKKEEVKEEVKGEENKKKSKSSENDDKDMVSESENEDDAKEKKEEKKEEVSEEEAKPVGIKKMSKNEFNAETFKSFENKLEEMDKQSKEKDIMINQLTEGLSLVIDNVLLLKKAMGSVISNGVSTFNADDPEVKTDSTKLNSIVKMAKGL